ncbi:endonuclease G, mitochondrial-like [Limulus polyphemus]|uniref:Endonuclease n=1 Tax=Limulus polyphemus TaxID=6850 RepID=A0ABM1BTB8_LIMPO|nr:endonuclease G, mitochondrial-like [Limulus polyphemus]
MSSNFVRFAITGFVGWMGGVTFEKWKNKSSVIAATSLEPVARSQVEPVPNATNVSQIMKFGIPGHNSIKTQENYVLSYDQRNRVAHWVFEHLTREGLKSNDQVDRSKCEFQEDTFIHPFFRSQNSDYKGSGFDRGHLAAAGNHRTRQELVNKTFFLSNIAPQVGKGFNRDKWNRLEKYVRHLTRNTYRNVYVCTGPLYLPREEPDGKKYVKYQVIGSNNVAVPTHFFKVIVGETDQREYDLEAYVMPNKVIEEDTPLSAFMVPIESIERAAGLLFFDKISRKTFRLINGRKVFPV